MEGGRDSAATVKQTGLPGTIITQFGFDVDPVITWLEAARHPPADPDRLPDPAGIKRLLALAGRFGVASSAGIAKKYGFSLTNLVGTAGPDRIINERDSRYDSARHGELKLHYYAFGRLRATQEWINKFESEHTPARGARESPGAAAQRTSVAAARAAA